MPAHRVGHPGGARRPGLGRHPGDAERLKAWETLLESGNRKLAYGDFLAWEDIQNNVSKDDAVIDATVAGDYLRWLRTFDLVAITKPSTPEPVIGRLSTWRYEVERVAHRLPYGCAAGCAVSSIDDPTAQTAQRRPLDGRSGSCSSVPSARVDAGLLRCPSSGKPRARSVLVPEAVTPPPPPAALSSVVPADELVIPAAELDDPTDEYPLESTPPMVLSPSPDTLSAPTST